MCAGLWAVATACAITRPPHDLLTRRELAAAALAIPAAAHGTIASPAMPAPKQVGMRLNTGVNFPTTSFGLQIYDDKDAEELTLVALECGYRNFFASVLARNQRGFARAIKRSGVPREDLFICGSVLSNQAQGFDAARMLSARGCRENLEAFASATDYVDMIMLDYPGPDDECAPACAHPTARNRRCRRTSPTSACRAPRPPPAPLPSPSRRG